MNGEEAVLQLSSASPSLSALPQNGPSPSSRTASDESEEEGGHFDLVFGSFISLVSFAQDLIYFKGLVVGFLLGLLVCYWIWERSAKNLPRRRFLGFLIGIVANVTLATIHVMKR
jgi:hypothetical protein